MQMPPSPLSPPLGGTLTGSGAEGLCPTGDHSAVTGRGTGTKSRVETVTGLLKNFHVTTEACLGYLGSTERGLPQEGSSPAKKLSGSRNL